MHRYATLRCNTYYAMDLGDGSWGSQLATQPLWEVQDPGLSICFPAQSLPATHGECPQSCLSEAARAAGRLAQVSEERCHHRGFAECSVSRAHAAVGARCSAPLCGHVASKQDWKGKGWWIGLSEGRWCENRIGWGNIEGVVDRIE